MGLGEGMQRHEWRERGEEEVRFYRVDYHASRWKMMSQLKGEEEWTPHDPMSVEDWKRVREVLWRKYQRKRCKWELIEKIDKQLEKMGAGEDD